MRDFRRYKLRAEDQYDANDLLELEQKSRRAWDTLKEVFEEHAELTEDFLTQGDMNSSHAVEEIIIKWKDQLAWPEDFNINGTIITASTAAECSENVSRFSDGKLWPFIKVVR